MAGVVRVVQVVQSLAQQRGADLLHIHDLFSRGASKMLMGERLRADHMERLAVCWLVGQQMPARSEHLAQLRAAFALVIAPDVCLMHQDQVLRAIKNALP